MQRPLRTVISSISNISSAVCNMVVLKIQLRLEPFHDISLECHMNELQYNQRNITFGITDGFVIRLKCEVIVLPLVECSAEIQQPLVIRQYLKLQYILQFFFSGTAAQYIGDGNGWVSTCEVRVVPPARHGDPETVARHTIQSHPVCFPPAVAVSRLQIS